MQRVEGIWIQLLGVRGVALVLLLFYVYLAGMHPQYHLSSQPLTIPTPWVFLGWSISLVLPWVTVSHFLARNRENELKPSNFSSLLLFLSFLFEYCLLGLLLNNNIYADLSSMFIFPFLLQLMVLMCTEPMLSCAKEC